MLARETVRAQAQLARILPPASWQGSSREMLLGALRGYLEAVTADPVTWRVVDGSGSIEAVAARVAAAARR